MLVKSSRIPGLRIFSCEDAKQCVTEDDEYAKGIPKHFSEAGWPASCGRFDPALHVGFFYVNVDSAFSATAADISGQTKKVTNRQCRDFVDTAQRLDSQQSVSRLSPFRRPVSSNHKHVELKNTFVG